MPFYWLHSHGATEKLNSTLFLIIDHKVDSALGGLDDVNNSGGKNFCLYSYYMSSHQHILSFPKKPRYFYMIGVPRTLI